jgi:hypothetical protein
MGTKANLIIDQGTTYATSITILDEYGTPQNLTNYTGAGQIRKHYTSSTATDFVVDLDPLDGTVIISLSANTTQSLTAGRYVYDVELTSSAGDVTRVLEGIVTVTPTVTR